MKKDLELIKKILLKIENEYAGKPLINIGIEGYDMQQIAYHVSLLSEGGLISKFNPRYGDGQIFMFTVGNLTNEGFNYLDKIRDEDNLKVEKKEKTQSNQIFNINSAGFVNCDHLINCTSVVTVSNEIYNDCKFIYNTIKEFEQKMNSENLVDDNKEKIQDMINDIIEKNDKKKPHLVKNAIHGLWEFTKSVGASLLANYLSIKFGLI